MRIATRIVLIVTQWVLGFGAVICIAGIVQKYAGLDGVHDGYMLVIFGSLLAVAMYWSLRLSKLGKRPTGEQPQAENAAIRFDHNVRNKKRA